MFQKSCKYLQTVYIAQTIVFVDVKHLQIIRYFSGGMSILEVGMTSQSHFTLANKHLLEHNNQNYIFCLWL